jgi:hypothetical protein
MAAPSFKNVPPITAGDVVAQDDFTTLPGGGTVYPAQSWAASGATPPAVEFGVPQRAQNLIVTVNVTAISGAGNTLTVNVEGYDKASNTWIPLLVSAGLVATGLVTMRVGPNITAASNVAAQSPLLETLRIRNGQAGTLTTLAYSIGASFSA